MKPAGDSNSASQENASGRAGQLPYRMAFAGGWIDQPFISRLNPSPPGSMVVVGIEPTMEFMTRAGMATGTRDVAMRLWNGQIPHRPKEQLVRELYAEENKDRPDPSGSQDMIGLIYPGICRLDYDASHERGYFPRHVECCTDPDIATWLERVIHLVPVAPRPVGYHPLGLMNLNPQWVDRLGRSGGECFDAIVSRDLIRLGASMNECMLCWQTLLPQTVSHPTIQIDLMAILGQYQTQYAGAMYSGCGGGYLYVVSDQTVPDSLPIKVRLA